MKKPSEIETTVNPNANAKTDGSSPAQGVMPNSGECAPFDPSRFRISQNFVETVGGKKHILVVQIRKPTKYEWIRVHPDEAWRIQIAMMIWKDDRESFYVVAPELWGGLAANIVPVLLVTVVNTQGAIFFWPLRLPGADGRSNDWHSSGLEASELAMQGKWVRVAANMSVGGYEVFSAEGNLGEPAWPEQGFAKLFEIAVRERLIDSMAHPVVRRLRGES